MLSRPTGAFLLVVIVLLLGLDRRRPVEAVFAQERNPSAANVVSWTAVGFYLDQLSISAQYADQRASMDEIRAVTEEPQARAKMTRAERKQAESAPADNIMAGITLSVQYLRERWLAGQEQQRPVPAIYAKSLELDSILLNAAELKELGGRTLTDQQAVSMLMDVADDLETKAQQCKRSSAGWASLIEVRVNTRKGSQILNGYEIWYVPKGWASVRSMWERFPRLSSPTDFSLPPGNYMMSVNKGQQEQIKVGGDGRNHEEIDLLAP